MPGSGVRVIVRPNRSTKSLIESFHLRPSARPAASRIRLAMSTMVDAVDNIREKGDATVPFVARNGPHQGRGLAHPARAVDEELRCGLSQSPEDAIYLLGPVRKELLCDNAVDSKRIGLLFGRHVEAPVRCCSNIQRYYCTTKNLAITQQTYCLLSEVTSELLFTSVRLYAQTRYA